MNKLTDSDLRYVVQHIPKDIRNHLKNYGGDLFIGGGFIRSVIAGEKINDIDLFGVNAEFLQVLSDVINNERENDGCKKHSSRNAITILTNNRTPIQLITRWKYSNPQDLVKDFDFTVCQAVVFFNKETRSFDSVISDSFYSDLAAKRLVYTAPIREEGAGGSLLRMIKYLKRGYNIQINSVASLIARLNAAISFGKHDEPRIIMGLLREVDPLLIIDGLDVIDDHEKTEKEENS